MHNPYVAILLAAIAAWVFGSVWYGVLAKAWMAALGNDPAQIEAKRKVRQVPYVAMAVSFACEIIMAWVLARILPFGDMGWIASVVVGLMVGIGLMVTPVLVNNMFAGRTLKLAVIDGVHWIGVAVIECLVLTALS